MAKRKSADQLVADIDARRARIVKTVGDLQSFAKPANVANRGLAKATSLFVDEDGKARPQRIAMAAAAAVGLLGLLKRKND